MKIIYHTRFWGALYISLEISIFRYINFCIPGSRTSSPLGYLTCSVFLHCFWYLRCCGYIDEKLLIKFRRIFLHFPSHFQVIKN